MEQFLVCTGQRILLPGNHSPVPATIIVDKVSGKITEVQARQCTRNDLPANLNVTTWVDAGNLVVLPGLVECVPFVTQICSSRLVTL